MPKKKPAAKATSKPAKPARPAQPRRVKLGKYQTFRLQKRIKHPVKLPSVRKMTRKTALTLWRHKYLFIGVTLIYGFVNLGLAQGFSGGTDAGSLKDVFNNVFTGHFRFLLSGLSTFAVMLTSAGNTTDQTAGTYQAILAVIASLAIIWSLRQAQAGSRPRIRDAYYKGMYPLIPFLLVMIVVSIQLFPLIIGSTLYSIVVNNGIAVYAAEKAVWILLFAVLALLSFYMLSSSLFALYIVTLPDMTPMKALRSARELVRYRRWTVLLKILCLPVILLAVALVIMLPIIIFLTPLARWAFFLLTMSALTATHAYMYTLYRELLNE